jgi:hypothetical protein
MMHDPPNHLFIISGEVALVLARGTSCAVLFDSNMCTSAFSFEYYTSVLAPWSERHEEFLRGQGFRVVLITHGLYVLNGPVWLLKVIISLTYSLDLIMMLHFSVTLVALDKVFLKKRSDKQAQGMDRG